MCISLKEPGRLDHRDQNQLEDRGSLHMCDCEFNLVFLEEPGVSDRPMLDQDKPFCTAPVLPVL